MPHYTPCSSAKRFYRKEKVLAVQLLDKQLEPSTQDKKSKPPHLSFWVEFLTTPEQAYNFLREKNPDSDKKLVLRLQASEIREIVGIADTGMTYPGLLDVIWVFLEKAIREERPGAKGHSGIIGLFEQSSPSGLTQRQAKNLRKYLRLKLAELASKDCFMLGE